MSAGANAARTGASDVLALGFGTATGMWALGYACRLPPAVVPGWLLLALLLACLLAGGFVAGRCTRRGWRGGLYATLLAATLNLLILGSLLGGDEPNRVVLAALWWIPGSYGVAAVLGVAGAVLGVRRRSRGAGAAESGAICWPNVFAWVLVGATLLLLIAGGLVTSNEAGLAVVDWPNSFGYNMFLYPLSRMTGGVYYEHAHRLFGSLVGLTTLTFAVCLQRVDERRWLHRLAWLALLAVVVQGVLGGLRVTGRFTLSTAPADTAPNITLAIVHGTLGQVFFGMVLALAVFTSPAWRAAGTPLVRPGASTDRRLTPIVVALLVLQIVCGAVLRHVAYGLLIHIALAVVVILTGVAAGLRAWGLYAGQPALRRSGLGLVILLGVQGLLGFAAYVVSAYAAGIQPRPAIDVVVTTAHQAGGAVVLAFAVGLTLWTHRLLAAGREAGRGRQAEGPAQAAVGGAGAR